MDKVIKIPVHSQIDVITNSSTEIFVHSENSIEPARELLAELLKMDGSDKKVDDVFEISTRMEEWNLEQMIEYGSEDIDSDELQEELGIDPKLPYKEKEKEIKRVVKEIMDGTRSVPEVLEDYDSGIQTFLVVKSKDPKYDKFLDLLVKLVYSPDWYEYSNN